jgi:hypothetical protein
MFVNDVWFASDCVTVDCGFLWVEIKKKLHLLSAVFYM